MQFDIEIRTIHMMKVIEEEGSMAKAADALFISQPALSSYIKRIENQLSFPLYKREKGRCYPTEAGKLLLSEGKLLLKQYNSILEKMKLAADSSSKELSLGWPMGYTVQYLHKIISNDANSFSMKVNIKEDSVENLIQQLLDKRLDLLLIPAIYSHPDILYKTLKREEFLLAVPKDHEANNIILKTSDGSYAELTGLSDMPFISLYAQAYKEFINPLFNEAGFNPEMIFMCNNWDSSHSLVEKGLGLTIVPYWFAEKENPKVNYYKIKSNCNVYRTFAFAYLRNESLSSKIENFMNKAIIQFGDEYAETPFNYLSLTKNI